MLVSWRTSIATRAASGAGLGTAWGEQKAVEMLHEAGFDDITVEHVEGDFMNVYYIARKH